MKVGFTSYNWKK